MDEAQYYVSFTVFFSYHRIWKTLFYLQKISEILNMNKYSWGNSNQFGDIILNSMPSQFLWTSVIL